jgi:ligand-binding sensor domain-containing protein/serine phosphatase RsbU (regulator of sigma subunit)
MRVNRFYIILFILLIYNSLYAQQYLPPEVLSVEEGMSSRQVHCLAIDKRGFLWSGTQKGLNRFDGYGFRQFFTTSPEAGYIGIQNILKIRNDFAGNLWILNEGGICRLDYKTGLISSYPKSSFDVVFKLESKLIDIYPSTDGTIWILSDQSLTMLSPEQVMNTYLIPAGMLNADHIPTSLVADPNGNIWIGSTGGLWLFNSQQKIFKEMAGKSTQGLLSDNRVNCMFLDEENTLWVGTKNGLNKVDPVDFAFYGYYPANTSSAVSLNNIIEIVGNWSGGLLLACESGICKLDKASLVFEKIPLDAAYSEGIETAAIDSSGNIWAGAQKGLLKIRKAKLLCSNYDSKHSSPKLAGDEVVALLPTVENDLLVGYRGSNFSFIKSKTSGISNYNTLDGSSIVDICPFKSHEYLIVSQHNIEVFSPVSNSRKNLYDSYGFTNKKMLHDATIQCAYYNGANVLWLGTSNGIQRIRFDSLSHIAKQYLSYQGQKVTLGRIYNIFEDPSGNLWMGTDKGLYFYNPAKGNYIRYTPYDIQIMNTENKAVYIIVPEKSNIFWIGTSGGVYRFDTRSHDFTAIANNHEIMNSSVRALNIDNQKNIWIATETVLFCYSRSNNTIKKYDVKDGLLNDSFETIASSSDNMVFLGGQSGLSVLRLPGTVQAGRIPDIAITGIRYLDNEAIQSDIYYQVSDTIILRWNRKPIKINFAVLEFSRPELNQFRYRFGKTRRDTEWKDLGTQNYIVLDNLVPGKYRLSIGGSDADMNWNIQGTSTVIIVEAPYWRSKIGLALMIIVGIFLVFLFFRFWIRQFFNLSRENQEREMFAKQIMLQKEELTLKNKSITDSINYAKRIQTAMLPPYKMFKSIFPSSFILFMPKDIVSGDFYWVNKFGSRIFVAAVDCTGHGVPGAFMSIIGFELFRKITNIEGLTRPSDILNRLNDDFHEIFKDVDNVVLRDGMDVAFCSIDKKDMILEFAGAFNPLYLIRDNKIMEVKGDRFAIGLDETNFREQTFKNHIIPIQKDDIVYIFSDGFSDQFGGPDGKKYKYRRFRHLLLNLHQLPMEKQHEILENNVMEWRGEQEQVDDILVIGIKIDF